MSNALSVAQDKKQPLDNRVANVRDVLLANKEKIGRGIAGMLTAERAIMVACNSIRKNPKLLEATPQSLFSAIAEAAVYGWVCDGMLGYASLVPFWSGQKKEYEVVLIPGYKGLRDLIRRSGECQTLMESVHEGDAYDFLGPFETPRHIRSTAADRRGQPLTHAYVLGRFRDGTIKCFSWTREECIAHRDRYSQNWKNSQKTDNPWHEDNPAFRVMCMKTVLLDAVHRGEFPLSVEDQSMAMRAEPALAPANEIVASITDDLDAPVEALEAPAETVIEPQGVDLEDALVEFGVCKTLTECDKIEALLLQHCVDDGQREAVTKMKDDRKKEIRDARGAGSDKKGVQG